MKILRLFVGLALVVTMTSAQTWDATKPATSGLLVSADIRSNWTSLAQSVGEVNLVADPTFLLWPAGDSAAPTHYSLSGTGATIARTGTGLGDTVRKVGDFAAKITSGGSLAAILEQQLLPTAAFSRADFLKGQTVSCGAWERGGSATSIRLSIYDGVGTTYSGYGGNASWSWVTLTRTIDASATLLAVRAEVTGGALTGYVSGITCLLGPVPPAYFQAAPVIYGSWETFLPGAQTVGATKQRWLAQRPLIIRDVQLWILSPPTGSALIVDVNTFDGALYTSMFSTRPQIAAGGAFGGAQPDTTYARRCMTTGGVGSILSIDVDQVGSTAAGSDLAIQIRYLMFARPLEAFLDYGDVR